MKIGMMWQDSSNLPLSTKIRGAITYYQKKYGITPTLIICNPKDYVECPEFAIQTSRSVRINHLWVGIGESDD